MNLSNSNNISVSSNTTFLPNDSDSVYDGAFMPGGAGINTSRVLKYASYNSAAGGAAETAFFLIFMAIVIVAAALQGTNCCACCDDSSSYRQSHGRRHTTRPATRTTRAPAPQNIRRGSTTQRVAPTTSDIEMGIRRSQEAGLEKELILSTVVVVEEDEEAAAQAAALSYRAANPKQDIHIISGGDDGVSQTQCAICLESYQAGDVVSFSKISDTCHHAFHKKCILNWLQKAHCRCPVCAKPYVNER